MLMHCFISFSMKMCFLPTVTNNTADFVRKSVLRSTYVSATLMFNFLFDLSLPLLVV